MDEDSKVTPEKELNDTPQPIEFKAILSPDGELRINCPLMGNPMLMRGFIDLVHDAVKDALSGKGSQDKPQIHTGPGLIDRVRRFGK